MTEKLRELFEPFQTITSHKSMIVTDGTYRILSFNAHAEALLGYKEKEVLGERVMLQWHDPKQLSERAEQYTVLLGLPVEANENALFALANNALEPDIAWNWRTKDGDKLVVTCNTSVMHHPDGSIKGYVLIARDVSDNAKLAATSTRQLEIMESAHDMI